jgi:SOS-response transcriptional repressor LexA
MYEFIIAYKKSHDGLSPTIREIADGLNYSPSNVYYHLGILNNESAINYNSGSAAGIEVTVGAE